MSKTSRYQGLIEHAKELTPKDFLSEKEFAQYERILQGFYRMRVGLRRNKSESALRDIGVVENFACFTRKPPWQWHEDHFADWCREIGEIKQLRVSTQAHYQGVLRRFLDYIIHNSTLNNEVKRDFNKSVRQICHDDLCIVYKCNRKENPRTSIPRKEINHIIQTYKALINEAERSHSKSLHTLQRDMVMYYVTYICGFRRMEIMQLDIDSFYPNEELPMMGDFGAVDVIGKGDKPRTVLVSHEPLKDAMEFYLEDVRPLLAANGDPNERALFLSERGERIKKSAVSDNFKKIIEDAGLQNKKYTLHYLRHAATTHDASRFSLDTNRRQRGHSFTTTTDNYTHFSSTRSRNEVTKVVRSELLKAKEKAAKNKYNENDSDIESR